MAIAVSISFVVAAPFSYRAELTYQKYKNIWDVYQKSTLNPKDEILDTEDSTVLIIEMGRFGADAYKRSARHIPQKGLG